VSLLSFFLAEWSVMRRADFPSLRSNSRADG
jgi:hypothetical protein